MTTKRFTIGGGGPGGSFRMRQALPGYSVDSAGLDGIVFDSDYYPGRILTQGQNVICDTNLHLLSNPNLDPWFTSIGHGAGKDPDMVLVTACPVISLANQTAMNWPMMYRTGATWFEGALGAPSLDFKFGAPFRVIGNNTGGPYSSGSGGYYFTGWWYAWDAGQIIVKNWCSRPLLVNWATFEL